MLLIIDLWFHLWGLKLNLGGSAKPQSQAATGSTHLTGEKEKHICSWLVSSRKGMTQPLTWKAEIRPGQGYISWFSKWCQYLPKASLLIYAYQDNPTCLNIALLLKIQNHWQGTSSQVSGCERSETFQLIHKTWKCYHARLSFKQRGMDHPILLGHFYKDSILQMSVQIDSSAPFSRNIIWTTNIISNFLVATLKK